LETETWILGFYEPPNEQQNLLVRRPTPTIGFAVASRTRPVHGSCQPSAKRLDAPESFDTGRDLPGAEERDQSILWDVES
jgi:hypothetical protein